MVLTPEQKSREQQAILEQLGSDQGQRDLQLRALSDELQRAEALARRKGDKNPLAREAPNRIRAEIERIQGGGEFTLSAKAQAISQRIVQSLPTKFDEGQSVEQRVRVSVAARGGQRAEEGKAKTVGVPSRLPGSVGAGDVIGSYAVIPGARVIPGAAPQQQLVVRDGLNQPYDVGLRPLFEGESIGGEGTAARLGRLRRQEEISKIQARRGQPFIDDIGPSIERPSEFITQQTQATITPRQGLTPQESQLIAEQIRARGGIPVIEPDGQVRLARPDEIRGTVTQARRTGFFASIGERLARSGSPLNPLEGARAFFEETQSRLLDYSRRQDALAQQLKSQVRGAAAVGGGAASGVVGAAAFLTKAVTRPQEIAKDAVDFGRRLTKDSNAIYEVGQEIGADIRASPGSSAGQFFAGIALGRGIPVPKVALTRNLEKAAQKIADASKVEITAEAGVGRQISIPFREGPQGAIVSSIERRQLKVGVTPPSLLKPFIKQRVFEGIADRQIVGVERGGKLAQVGEGFVQVRRKIETFEEALKGTRVSPNRLLFEGETRFASEKKTSTELFGRTDVNLLGSQTQVAFKQRLTKGKKTVSVPSAVGVQKTKIIASRPSGFTTPYGVEVTFKDQPGTQDVFAIAGGQVTPRGFKKKFDLVKAAPTSLLKSKRASLGQAPELLSVPARPELPKAKLSGIPRGPIITPITTRIDRVARGVFAQELKRGVRAYVKRLPSKLRAIPAFNTGVSGKLIAVPKSSLVPAQSPIQNPILKPTTIPLQRPISKTLQQPVVVPIQRPISRTLQQPVSLPLITPGSGLLGVVPVLPPPPTTGPIGGFIDFGQRNRPQLAGSKRGFAPSLAGVAKGLRLRRAPKGLLSGLEQRGVVTRRKLSRIEAGIVSAKLPKSKRLLLRSSKLFKDRSLPRL